MQIVRMTDRETKIKIVVCILCIVFDYLLPFGVINDDDSTGERHREQSWYLRIVS